METNVEVDPREILCEILELIQITRNKILW
jgi:hypothetical protein